MGFFLYQRKKIVEFISKFKYTWWYVVDAWRQKETHRYTAQTDQANQKFQY